jgi:hypothetical protein
MTEMVSSPRIIFADGVVASGRNRDDHVLSCRPSDRIMIGDSSLSAFSSIWGEWHQNGYREVRLYLTLNGRQILEGENGSEPLFFEVARRIARRRRSLSADIGVLFFNFAAAHAHLRSLLHTYAWLTSVIGPQMPFDQSPVCSIDYPEAYAHFDACLSALRSFGDSTRFIIWRILGRSKGIPRNLRALSSADLPQELSQVLQKYLDSCISDLTEYRDNAVHYAPPGAHMAPWLLWSKAVIHAQVWLPRNPDVRSLKHFKYDQKDAFKYARGLLEQSYAFCDELFPVLDECQRRQLREKRRARGMN